MTHEQCRQTVEHLYVFSFKWECASNSCVNPSWYVEPDEKIALWLSPDVAEPHLVPDIQIGQEIYGEGEDACCVRLAQRVDARAHENVLWR